MFIEKYLACPCSFNWKDHLFSYLHIVPPMSPFKCNCFTIFDNITGLLRHLKPSQIIRDNLSNMNGFHKVLHCWLMFYRYSRDKSHELHIKQIINPYTTLLLSSSSIKNIRLLILICS